MLLSLNETTFLSFQKAPRHLKDQYIYFDIEERIVEEWTCEHA